MIRHAPRSAAATSCGLSLAEAAQPRQGWVLLIPKQAGAQSCPQAPIPLQANHVWVTVHCDPCYSKEPKAHKAVSVLGDFSSGEKKMFKAIFCFNLTWL